MPPTASPLRYPGGKTCLLGVVSSILRLNELERSHYIEPYAGGCGLALSLLYGGHVADIHINDIDPAVWAFWYCVLHRTDDLVDLIERTPITVDQWRRQRSIYRKQNLGSRLALGFSAFFLNRTNRSGIIKGAGVIGGLGQTGTYKIDCRFNREDLVRRVVRVGKYRDRIHLSNMDAIDFMALLEKSLSLDSLFFIDPPYFKKGASLYTNFYRPMDHANLARRVVELRRHWVVTYDDTPEIQSLYESRRQYRFGINYSLSDKRVGTEILVASDGLRIPEVVRARQVSKPQYGMA